MQFNGTQFIFKALMFWLAVSTGQAFAHTTVLKKTPRMIGECAMNWRARVGALVHSPSPMAVHLLIEAKGQNG